MGIRRLRQEQKLLASKAAKRVLAADLPRSEVRAALRAEARAAGIDPALIILFVQIAWAIYKYFTTNNVAPAAAEAMSDESAVLASVRYME